MTNDPADAARPQTPHDEVTEPSLAPPAPPPGPLWPSVSAPPAAAASANGWPSTGDAQATPPPGTVPPPSWSPSSGPAFADSTASTAPGPADAPTGPAAGPDAAAGPDPAGGPGGTGGLGAGLSGFGSAFGAAFGPGFKSRYGLVRPITGRHFAGVCAAVARATNTDPVLWRVLFAVLTLFGGVGLLAYLIGWLLIPADGDTASPIEAVLGRGRSRTSGPIAVIGALVALLVFAVVASEGLRPAVVGALVVLGAAVLLSRGTLQRPGQPAQGPFAPEQFQPEPVMPPPFQPGQFQPGQFQPGQFQPAPDFAAPFAAAPAPVAPDPHIAPAGPDLRKAPAAEPVPESAQTAVEPERQEDLPVEQTHIVPPVVETPTAPQVPQVPQVPRPPQLPYGEPFAPHGPFAGPPGPYPPAFGPVGPQPTRRLPLYGPYPPIPGAGLPLSASPVSADPMLQYPGMPYSAPPAAPQRKPKRPKSRLGRATLSATAIALGTLAIVHVAGASLDVSVYFAVALAVVGLGLVVGAWLGRARLLIPLGVALSIGMLAATASVNSYDSSRDPSQVFNPTTVEEILANSGSNLDHGNLHYDFTRVDFNNQQVTFETRVEFGQLTVIVPRNVDVEVRAKIEFGDAKVFDARWGGISDQRRVVINHGDDGPGGGNLTLVLSVDAGNLEVHR